MNLTQPHPLPNPYTRMHLLHPHQAEKRELESANEELRTALDAALGEARALSSRATVAEESREAASQTLLNLTQRAAVLEAEKQVGWGLLWLFG